MFLINSRADYRKALEFFKDQQEKATAAKDTQFNKGHTYGLRIAMNALKDWEICQPDTEAKPDPESKSETLQNTNPDSGVSLAPIVRRKRLETWQDLFIFDLSDEEFDDHFQADTHHEKCLKSWLRCLCQWIKRHDIRKI